MGDCIGFTHSRVHKVQASAPENWRTHDIIDDLPKVGHVRKEACRHNTFHDITISKECLINSQIMFQYFQISIFFQLHLLKLLFKFIVMRLSYGRQKKGCLFAMNTVYI